MSLPDADVVLLQPGDMGSGEDLLVVSNATMMEDDNDDFDTVATINFVAYNVVAFVIVGVGIVGNILNLVVLSRPKLKVCLLNIINNQSKISTKKPNDVSRYQLTHFDAGNKF